MLINILKLVLVAATIPLLLGPYQKKAKSKTGHWFFAWCLGNWAFYVIMTTFIAVSFIDYRDNTDPDDNGELIYMDKQQYDRELDSLKILDSVWPGQKKELMRKFDFALYAIETGDFQKGLEALRELEIGQDTNGPLRVCNSYVVANNMGCLYFEIKRNRRFSASQSFLAAKSRAKSRITTSNANWLQIETNLNTLDDLVNNRD